MMNLTIPELAKLLEDKARQRRLHELECKIRIEQLKKSRNED